MELYLFYLFLIGLVLNALFAGYETGFVSSNVIRVRHLAEKEKDPNAIRLMRFMEQPDRMIIVVLLGTNLALVLGTLALTKALETLPFRQVAAHTTFWATVIATPTFLIFGEVMPKSMFRIHPTRLALRLFPLIRFFDLLLLPFSLPIAWVSRRFLALVEAEQRDIRKMLMSQDDVRSLIDESAHHGTIEAEEQEMIHSVMDLQTRTAKEVMVPRINIMAIPETAARAELVAILKESGHTRIPIYRDTIDEVIGVVSAFSLLTDTAPDKPDIARFIKAVIHVHDTMKLDELLKLMRDSRQSIAIVTDEYGGTDGLVTLEDILEEIFGEFHDEYDKEETRVRRVGKNAFVIDARTPLEEAAEALEVPLTDEEVETIGGWIMHLTGRIPARGEVIEHGRFRITILEGGPNYIASIRLEIQPEAEPPKAEQSSSSSA
ncbi:MAG: HlyC/CorC family transporter [Candidatus Hydrogenedentes bacterium]|nr:HlyC/CorC family transporter [Candidatus Hydrogenedentota bacterium]